MPIPVEIPITKHFGKDTVTEIDRYVHDRLKSLVEGSRVIREDKIKQWRKVYAGTPREKNKSFPWPNCSNIVPPIVGSYVDQLTAKIVMGIFGIDPLWVAGLCGEFTKDEKAEEQRGAIEEWLSYAGLEPGHLHLMPKYTVWIRTMVKYGLGTMKLIPEMVVEQVAEHVTSSGVVTFGERLRHDGPVALPLIFEDFLIPATSQELQRDPMVAQRCVMERWQVEPLTRDASYIKDNVIKVLKNADRQGPDAARADLERETGVESPRGDGLASQWDIYECHLPYSINGKRFQFIYTYHLGSETPIKRVFNWLPENSIPFIPARLGNDGERSHGLGFCEMLKDFQEEVAAIHNRRGDAGTLANTNILRAGPGLQLDANFSIYPNAIITGENGALEVIPLGRDAAATIEDEKMSLQLCQDRAGVGASSSGPGAGGVNKKGQYGAMNTWMIQSEGNTRANLNLTEFRGAHYVCGRQALMYYAHFGVAEKDLKALRAQGVFLKKALESYKEGRIILPIRAATGSVNKEIEKQSLMLLLNNVRAHWQQVNQMMQATSNPMAPPEQQEYLMQVILSSNLLMKKIVKEFGLSDPSQYIPEPLGIEEKTKAINDQKKQQAQGPQSGGESWRQPPSWLQGNGQPQMPEGVQQ